MDWQEIITWIEKYIYGDYEIILLIIALDIFERITFIYKVIINDRKNILKIFHPLKIIKHLFLLTLTLVLLSVSWWIAKLVAYFAWLKQALLTGVIIQDIIKVVKNLHGVGVISDILLLKFNSIMGKPTLNIDKNELESIVKSMEKTYFEQELKGEYNESDKDKEEDKKHQENKQERISKIRKNKQNKKNRLKGVDNETLSNLIQSALNKNKPEK